MPTDPCGCWAGAWWGITDPPRCLFHGGGHRQYGADFTWTGTTVPTYGPPPQRLSDEDVERIAKRVAELLGMSGNKKAEPALTVTDDAASLEGSG
jgi:hypothetical protein